MKKFILPVLITLWAILFYLIGIYNSNADMMMNSITSPAYHFIHRTYIIILFMVILLKNILSIKLVLKELIELKYIKVKKE